MADTSYASSSVVRPSATQKIETTKKIEFEEKKTYTMIKRGMDIIGASMGLIFLSWLFLIVAVLIKIEDPKGTVFFKQVRVGKNGKTFYMYKFRSMVSDAEEKLKDLLKYNEIEGAMFKLKEDPRVTKIGKFIRKTSIDELPQLWNVLKGEMSLVGPRPPLPREVADYTKYDMQRLLVKPGCTGLWQVSGRSELSFCEMVDLDINYITNRTIWLDIKLILKTLKIMIIPNNAY
ncbi:sugar transferase [Heyndrickxia coagulans]|uniref:Exopolysaccharide biosynthesis polyprenyl glycosylphosphotransferase n=1 Tax=Heyndrickxia coagulans DSM 1 = ATCC 7050 TaxID=1121088 RepID=A0A8B4BVR8_HEYCO|nr:sugar transferase [Heyndrickxia coagulans]AJH80139.1 bacterial sugar transferase family protein [Heyndrickxia coagulans DSM 1 = ATCC 7050]MCR2846557.1 sugar transferase [Heyndrickxia coagulans]MDR4224813.1 sugar transferase [Heyndrickxia coagulans DSM 1 = ATCC 7050]QQS93617.1 sugar transferase [Heyndrickxia coagulans]UYM81391.1 sugar transferase [Heyndrickxia coagulans]